MKKYALDKKDVKILETFCDNARLSYNQIAKATQISKDSVRKRIDKLKQNLFILSYFPLINYPSLGLKLFHVYLRLNSLEEFDEKIIKKLTAENKVVSITWILGKYDLEIQLLGKNKKEVLKKVHKLIPLSRIKELDTLTSEELKIYSMNPNKKENKILKINKELVNLDKKDYELLELLAKDGRVRIIDLVEPLKIDESNIRYKIKRLLKEQVILGFYARTNKHRLGFNTYILLIKLNKEMKPNELEGLRKISNLFYLKKCSGKYDYMVRFHAINNKQLISTLATIRETLKNNLKNFEVFSILERRKFLPF